MQQTHFSSGFEEEFQRASDRRSRTGEPNIALYFKRSDISANPDERDHEEIAAFKARTSQDFLHNEIAGPDDWKTALIFQLLDQVEGSGPRSPNDRFTEHLVKDRDGILKMVGHMPDREKTVLTLYYYEGLTLGEIADILGVSDDRVSGILSAALLLLSRYH